MATPRESSEKSLRDHLIIAARTLLFAINLASGDAGPEYQDPEVINRVIKRAFDNTIEDLENFENHPHASVVDIINVDTLNPYGPGLIPTKLIVNNLISELKDNRKEYVEDVDYTNEDALDFFERFVNEKLLLFQTRASMILNLQEQNQEKTLEEFERLLIDMELREGEGRKRTKKTKRHRRKTKSRRRKTNRRGKKRKSRKTKRRRKM